MKKYNPPEMLPYSGYDRESAIRLAAQERFEMVIKGRNVRKTERRSAK